MNEQLRGFPVTFNIYASSAEEADEMRSAIVGFIASHARSGRAVTARKVASAIASWDKNIIVRNQIIKYFS